MTTYNLRSIVIAPGRAADAMSFAVEVCKLANSHGIKTQVVRPVGGQLARVAWLSEYPNLGAVETTMDKLAADPKYVEMTRKASDCFVAGSAQDEIWRTV